MHVFMTDTQCAVIHPAADNNGRSLPWPGSGTICYLNVAGAAGKQRRGAGGGGDRSGA